MRLCRDDEKKVISQKLPVATGRNGSKVRIGGEQLGDRLRLAKNRNTPTQLTYLRAVI